MRISTLLIIALLTVLTVSIWQNSRGVDLETIRKADPVLDKAIDDALNHDNDETLALWLAEQNEFDREIYRRSAFTFAYKDDPKKLSELELCKRTFEHRFLFTPFLRIGTGNAHVDNDIDNRLGYSLVFGPTDNNQRASVKPLLEKIVVRLEIITEKNKSPQIIDTIGCIYFELGKKDKALVAFNQVMELMPKSNLSKKEKDVLKDLVQRRIMAI